MRVKMEKVVDANRIEAGISNFFGPEFFQFNVFICRASFHAILINITHYTTRSRLVYVDAPYILLP